MEHNKQIRNKWEAAYYFSYKILKFTNQSFSYRRYTSYILPTYYDMLQK